MRRGGTVESGKQYGGCLGEEPSNKVVFGRTSDGMSTLMNVLAISATSSPREIYVLDENAAHRSEGDPSWLDPGDACG
jgi:hypothetical protein